MTSADAARALVTSWGSARAIARTSAIGPFGPLSTADPGGPDTW